MTKHGLKKIEITCSDRKEVVTINKASNMVGVDIVEDVKIVKVTLESICNTFFLSRSGI